MRAWLALALLVRGQIHILSPQALLQEFSETRGNVYGTTATFGTPYYGERVLGRVRYGLPKTDHHHCTRDGYDIPELPPGQVEMLRIVMVDRGECTFVSKVRIAQEYKDAHGVIVVDNQGLTSEAIQHIIMADDGWGGGHRVEIPSVMISGGEGEKFKRHILNGEEVLVELAWDIPSSNVVSIDFWMSSGSTEAADFLDRFKPFVDMMKYQVQFTPHFHIFALPENLNSLCFDSTHKFCGPDPDGAGPITGQRVVVEDLRQLCIWHHTKVADPNNQLAGATFSPKYWEYLDRFHARCLLNDQTGALDTQFGDKCAIQVMKDLDIDYSRVMSCMTEKKDSWLEDQRTNVAWSPLALRVNGWRYSGPLDPVTVLKAVCSGFLSPPDECEEINNVRYTLIHHVSGVSILQAFFVVSILLLVLVALFFLYKRYLKKSVRSALREEVMLEVRTQMQDYHALDDSSQSSRRVF